MPRKRDPNMLSVKKLIEEAFGDRWQYSGREFWHSRDGRRISLVDGELKLIGQGEPKELPSVVRGGITWLKNQRSESSRSTRQSTG